MRRPPNRRLTWSWSRCTHSHPMSQRRLHVPQRLRCSRRNASWGSPRIPRPAAPHPARGRCRRSPARRRSHRGRLIAVVLEIVVVLVGGLGHQVQHTAVPGRALPVPEEQGTEKDRGIGEGAGGCLVIYPRKRWRSIRFSTTSSRIIHQILTSRVKRIPSKTSPRERI